VTARIAGDMRERIVAGNVPAGFADYRNEFCLVVDLVGVWRKLDRIAVCPERSRKLVEDDRVRVDLGTGLFRMIGIVEPNAENLLGIGAASDGRSPGQSPRLARLQ